MEQFIYVMKKEDRDKLLKRGFHLLKEDELSSLWIFENNAELDLEFAKDAPRYVFSDILSF